MLLRLCQLKSLVACSLLALSGCSYFQSSREGDAQELLSDLPHHWFSQNPRHSLWNNQGKPFSHHFFDVQPEWSKDRSLVNVVITTPQNSEHSYELDLPSGQRYYSHSYCAQSDIWGKYSGSIERPKFSLAIIPRMLDQIGEPQKVVVFGGAKKFARLANFHQHRVKLIGAVIEQICPEGNCLGKSNWVSHMVYLAVDPHDKKFKNITDIKTFSEKVDWEEMKAVLENLDGRNPGTGTNNYPLKRIGQLISFQEAIDYGMKRSLYMSPTETQKIQKGCHALYDRLWKHVGAEREEDRPARSLEELKAKMKLHAELKKKKKAVGFAARFKVFTKKFYKELSTCQKFVYAGNVNQDREAFWFLSYVGVFYKLHKEGHYFDCRNKAWKQNVLNNEGNPIHDLERDIDQCSGRDLDIAMDYLPNYLTGLKSSGQDFFRFVDYDMHSFGSHQKLYSWVKIKERKYDCFSDPNAKVRKGLKVFPDDIDWKPREVSDIQDDMKIIY